MSEDNNNVTETEAVDTPEAPETETTPEAPEVEKTEGDGGEDAPKGGENGSSAGSRDSRLEALLKEIQDVGKQVDGFETHSSDGFELPSLDGDGDGQPRRISPEAASTKFKETYSQLKEDFETALEAIEKLLEIQRQTVTLYKHEYGVAQDAHDVLSKLIDFYQGSDTKEEEPESDEQISSESEADFEDADEEDDRSDGNS